MLKGEERVRKRPAVIFGSDDLEGCKHAVFEIVSNAIDEAREGHGDTIIITRYEELPTAGTVMEYDGLRIKILRTTRSRIELARVERVGKNSSER